MSDATYEGHAIHPHLPLVLWADDAKQTGFACLPIFCEEDGCTCRVVRLLAVAIDERFEALEMRGPGVFAIDYRDGTSESVGRDTRHVRATVDLDSGLVAVDSEAKSGSRSQAVMSELQALVDGAALAGLRARLRVFEDELRRDAELTAHEAWPERDWSDWDGEDIDWQEVRPDQPAGRYEVDGTAYEAREMYCSDIECVCTELGILFQTPDADDVVGEVTIDGPSGQIVGTRSIVGRHALLLRLWEAFAGRRDLSELEARRQRVLTIAPRVEAIQLRQLREAERTRPQAGRNDPCPCGSGKKYKRCCLA
jgi:hypothetical protein